MATATINPDSTVTVAWETSAEWDHAGFNVYRSNAENGVLVQVNGAIIASEGTQGQGASYRLVDQAAAGSLWYTLEDIDIHGVRTLHGPISAEVSTPTAITLVTSYTPTTLPALLILSAILLAITLAICVTPALGDNKYAK